MHRLLALLTLGLTLATPSAHAQTCDQAGAQSAHQKALGHYEERSYELALRSFERAYDLCPYPVFLQSASVCAAALGRYPRALDLSARALEVQGRRGDAVGGLSRREQTQLLGHQRAWQLHLRALEHARALPTPLPPQPHSLPPPPFPWPRTLAWTGVAVLGMSGMFTLALNTQLQAIEDLTLEDRANFEPLRNNARIFQTAGRVTLFAGAGLLLAAGVLWVWPGGGDAAVSVGPGSVELRARF